MVSELLDAKFLGSLPAEVVFFSLPFHTNSI